jgi:hypothetical protein
MPSRTDSSEGAFPEPFSPREVRDADAGGESGDFPSPFRIGGGWQAEPLPADGADPPAQDEPEEALPWLVTRDEAGTSAAPVPESAAAEPDAAAWPAEPPAPEDAADAPGADTSDADTALPDWLDIDLGEDEPGDEDVRWPAGEVVPEPPVWEADADAEAETAWEEAEGDAFPVAEGPDAAPEQEGPRLVPADDLPDPTPPAGTSLLAGGALDERSEDVREIREAAPEEMTGSIGDELNTGARESAARRLEEIADWLREADLGEELAAADERGVRLFLAGVVLGRREPPRG